MTRAPKAPPTLDDLAAKFVAASAAEDAADAAVEAAERTAKRAARKRVKAYDDLKAHLSAREPIVNGEYSFMRGRRIDDAVTAAITEARRREGLQP